MNHAYSCQRTISGGQTCGEWCGNKHTCLSTLTYASPALQEAYEKGHFDAKWAMENELAKMAQSTSPHRRVAAEDFYRTLCKIRPVAFDITPAADSTAASGVAATRPARLDMSALKQWLVDVSQNKANTPQQQLAAWLLLQTATTGVPAVAVPKRPDNFEFAMEFLGDPEATTLREYIEALERAAGVNASDQGCAVHGLAHPCEACAAELPYRELLEHWTHESHLQTFEDRERFRKAARALLDGDGVAAARHQPPVQKDADDATALPQHPEKL
jgi:hypothetical protein